MTQTIRDFGAVLRPDHWPTLVFEAGDGDLCRCSCGEQGYDYTQGREWFSQHIVALLDAAPPEATTDG